MQQLHHSMTHAAACVAALCVAADCTLQKPAADALKEAHERPKSLTLATTPVHFSCFWILCWLELLRMPKALPDRNCRLQNVTQVDVLGFRQTFMVYAPQ
jgi:hypothetical protein